MTASLRNPSIGGHSIVLFGERVALRPYDEESMRSLRRWYADPELTRLSRHRQRPVSDDEFDEVVASRISSAEMLAFAIYERIEGDLERLVGGCTLASLDLENGSASYHIAIGEPDARGRGIGSAATRLAADFALGGLGLNRLSLTVFSFNTAAIRCYERVGFREEGRAREAIIRDGQRWDEIQMGLLASDRR
ncbi:MAG: N-acetyltransferase [Chloroflexi bacterium]|nr:MAG: N-acetyltransferase [Chloroflexota bacterium]RLT29584.1 MAG: N-acetyltransferase [Chloroflexota bacterium]